MVLRFRPVLTVLALLLGSGAAHAQVPDGKSPKAVIELFTSQGCSSCPPADALIMELSKDPGLVALTLPVTYWDYLGWKDTLGKDSFAKRQKLYSKSRGDGQVYTPQAVINGATHIIGSDKTEIQRAVSQEPSGLTARISLQEEAETLKISLSAGPDGTIPNAGVWVLPISRVVSVPIARGENQGRTISYANVVRGMVRVGDWNGKETVISAPLAATKAPEADGYVVLVQAEQPGRYGMLPGAILGASSSQR